MVLETPICSYAAGSYEDYVGRKHPEVIVGHSRVKRLSRKAIMASYDGKTASKPERQLSSTLARGSTSTKESPTPDTSTSLRSIMHSSVSSTQNMQAHILTVRFPRSQYKMGLGLNLTAGGSITVASVQTGVF
jgi:hypothetical protein